LTSLLFSAKRLEERVKMRQVIVYRDEDGNWCASCPSLPGCHSQGDTREEAITNIKEAIALYIEALKADNLPVPNETRGLVTLMVP
jgi:predicted RNase H-like HicB family nuclease